MRYYSLFILRCDDGKVEVEVDGPFDQRTRNVRASHWFNDEKQEGDQALKLALYADGKINVDIFEESDLKIENVSNPRCDGVHCLCSTGEVRLMPLPPKQQQIHNKTHAPLCIDCYTHEAVFRHRWNRRFALNPTRAAGDNPPPFDIPQWKDLEVAQ